MNKIWYRNPLKSEVICRCGGDEQTEWPRRTDTKSNAKKLLKNVHGETILNKVKYILSHNGSRQWIETRTSFSKYVNNSIQNVRH